MDQSLEQVDCSRLGHEFKCNECGPLPGEGDQYHGSSLSEVHDEVILATGLCHIPRSSAEVEWPDKNLPNGGL
jgi:hypothetical protein